MREHGRKASMSLIEYELWKEICDQRRYKLLLQKGLEGLNQKYRSSVEILLRSPNLEEVVQCEMNNYDPQLTKQSLLYRLLEQQITLDRLLEKQQKLYKEKSTEKKLLKKQENLKKQRDILLNLFKFKKIMQKY